MSKTIPVAVPADQADRGDIVRGVMIGIISFLTLIDLFAAQAILPSLAEAFDVSAASMGSAVNASTFGMAIAGLAMAALARKIDRRKGIWIALALLAIPTFLLAFVDSLTSFAALRVMQGLCMASAFTLTMAYLAEECTPKQAAGALAAYITGNVASNLLGRIISANVVGQFGLATSFYLFAGLNLIGAFIAFIYIRPSMQRQTSGMAPPPILSVWRTHLTTPGLPPSFAVGFLILFAFLGIFTYVNFVLSGPLFALTPGQLGLVYLVFVPSMVTTPLAGPLSQKFGARVTIWGSITATIFGVQLTMLPSLPAVLAGLAVIGVGTFAAQAAATGYVSGAAVEDRSSASGLYLTSYYVGGLLGTAVLGAFYTSFGWAGVASGVIASCVAIIIAAFFMPPAMNVLSKPSSNGVSHAQ